MTRIQQHSNSKFDKLDKRGLLALKGDSFISLLSLNVYLAVQSQKHSSCHKPLPTFLLIDCKATQ